MHEKKGASRYQQKGGTQQQCHADARQTMTEAHRTNNDKKNVRRCTLSSVFLGRKEQTAHNLLSPKLFLFHVFHFFFVLRSTLVVFIYLVLPLPHASRIVNRNPLPSIHTGRQEARKAQAQQASCKMKLVTHISTTRSNRHAKSGLHSTPAPLVLSKKRQVLLSKHNDTFRAHKREGGFVTTSRLTVGSP